MASSLEAAIKDQFGFQTELCEGHDGIFEVSVADKKIYTNQSKCGQLPSTFDILNKLATHDAVRRGEASSVIDDALSSESMAGPLPSESMRYDQTEACLKTDSGSGQECAFGFTLAKYSCSQEAEWVKVEELQLATVPTYTGSQGCDCSAGTCCDRSTNVSGVPQASLEKIKITIDGEEVEATSHDRNVVAAAERSNITIPAPCYRAKRKGGNGGCCRACVVEVDGALRYACGTAPRDGMDIVVNRDDLRAIRKKRLAEHRQVTKAAPSCG